MDGFRVRSLYGPHKIQSKYRVRDPVIEIDPDCENYLTAGSINTLIDLMVKK